MTIRTALATIAACVAALACLGAGVGYCLGKFVPAYYRSVFTSGRAPEFDPVSVGVGQGLTQGVAGGVMTGLAVVALLCWRETRLPRLAGSPPPPEGPPQAPHQGMRTLLLVVGWFMSLGFCFLTAVPSGIWQGQEQTERRRYDEECNLIDPTLAADPAFARVSTGRGEGGAIYLWGDVPTEADLERLREVVSRALGEARAAKAMRGVKARR